MRTSRGLSYPREEAFGERAKMALSIPVLAMDILLDRATQICLFRDSRSIQQNKNLGRFKVKVEGSREAMFR